MIRLLIVCWCSLISYKVKDKQEGGSLAKKYLKIFFLTFPQSMSKYVARSRGSVRFK